ncbi:MAG: amidohydrolase family protein [Nitrospinota bacterium]|nr:amidohydrolase family protein [Nitrospinota bacterium]
MATLLKAGIIYPVTSHPIENGYILVDKGKVAGFGPINTATERVDNIIDLSSHIVLPGFVNAHCHLQLSGMRGRKYPGSFSKWIPGVIRYNMETPQDLREASMKEAIEEMQGSGISAVGDIASSGDFVSPLAGSRLKGITFLEPLAPHEKDAEEALQKTRATAEELARRGIDVGIAPHSAYNVSPKLLKLLKMLAEELSIPFSIHLAETLDEDEFIWHGSGELAGLLEERGFLPDGFRGYGKSPVAHLHSLGILENTLAVHLNEIDENDIKLLASANAVPVFCPGSSVWFGRGNVMPLKKLLDYGLKPALGTDSLASNSSLSMLNELRMGAAYFPSLPRERLIEMATVNGARALDLNSGSIEKGRDADLIAFKMKDGLKEPLDAVFKAKKADFVMLGAKN